MGTPSVCDLEWPVTSLSSETPVAHSSDFETYPRVFRASMPCPALPLEPTDVWGQLPWSITQPLPLLSRCDRRVSEWLLD